MRPLICALAVFLAACSGEMEPDQDFQVEVRTLSPEFASRKAVFYAPTAFPDRISVPTSTVDTSTIDANLEKLAQGGFGLIRLLDCQTIASMPLGGSTETILQQIGIKKLDIKVQLGAYILSDDEPYNRGQLECVIQLANSYSSVVLAVSVGNENMMSGSINPVGPAKMAGYIATVRNAIKQPVTSDDHWRFYSGTDLNMPNVVLNAIDFVSIHTNPLADSMTEPPLWDWRQTGVPEGQRAAAMMNAAIIWAQTNYASVRSYLDGAGYRELPITIGQTGWKTMANREETHRAGPINQAMYYEGLAAWRVSATLNSKPAAIFFFEFLERGGSDNGWALLVSGLPQCAVLNLYPANPAVFSSLNCNLADALYYTRADNPTITESRYTLFADVAVAGEVRPTELVVWNYATTPESDSSMAEVSNTTSAPDDGPNSVRITPIRPAIFYPGLKYWAVHAALPTTSDDLSNFAAGGALNFSFKSTVPRSVSVFFGGRNSGYQIYLDSKTQDYGFIADGSWHNVSIPIAAMIRGDKVDMTKITRPFGMGGSAYAADAGIPFYVDNVYWSK